MARQLDPNDPGDTGGGTGPGPGGTEPPPTDPDTKLALQVTSTNVTITSDQIVAAGGPWPSFKLRVTPFNANGAGVSAGVTLPST